MIVGGNLLTLTIELYLQLFFLLEVIQNSFCTGNYTLIIFLANFYGMNIPQIVVPISLKADKPYVVMFPKLQDKRTVIECAFWIRPIYPLVSYKMFQFFIILYILSMFLPTMHIIENFSD